jgi:hypothetical protein
VTAGRRIAAALAALSPRERTLLALAAGLGATALAVAAVRAAVEDLTTLRARVAGHERELHEVRRLAAVLRERSPGSAPRADHESSADTSLLTRLEGAAQAAVGRERIASMTPAGGETRGDEEERVALRITGASLAETVRLLHALETGPPPLDVVRLQLRKHPDDPARFDVTVEVARSGRAAG